MFDNYKEPYDYVKSQASEIKTVVSENKIGFFQRLESIPSFFREGFEHIHNVKAIFPLVLIKLCLMLLVTFITILASIKGINWIDPTLLAQEIQPYVEEGTSSETIITWVHIVLFMAIWLPYFALILLLEGVFNGAMGAATYLHAEGRPVTVGAALNIAKQQSPTIWKFRIIQSIFLSLTARRKNEGIFSSLAKQALRQAWMFGTAGMMPAILNGRSLLEAVKRSIEFLKITPVKVISLILVKQLISSALVIGMFGIGYLVFSTEFIPLIVFIPVLFIILLSIQPVYISILYMLYVCFLKEKKYPLEITPSAEAGTFTTWVLAVYVFFTGGVFLIGLL